MSPAVGGSAGGEMKEEGDPVEADTVDENLNMGLVRGLAGQRSRVF